LRFGGIPWFVTAMMPVYLQRQRALYLLGQPVHY
jgi:hypothetical protein